MFAMPTVRTVTHLLPNSPLAHGNACNACSGGNCPASWKEQRAASVLDPASYPGPDGDSSGDCVGDDGVVNLEV